MKRKNISVKISVAIALLVLAALAVFAFVMPRLVDFYTSLRGRADFLTAVDKIAVKVMLYLILIPAFAADISLISLLRIVDGGKVFTEGSVKLLRIISYCCFAEVVLYCAISKYFILGLVVAFAALFLGIVLRVVKNVIEEAVAIKAENDFTV